MERLAKDLHLFTLARGAWTNFSWLLQRKGGNVLVACADATEVYDDIEQLGGVDMILMTDNHFALKWQGEAAERFGATIVAHKVDEAKLKKKWPKAKLKLIDKRSQLGDDLLAVPTPGHADGGLCYHWTPGKDGFLFTGDFLAHAKSGWAVFCGKAKRKIMAASLATVGELKVKLLCPGCSEGDAVSHVSLKSGEFKKLVDDTIEKFCTS